MALLALDSNTTFLIFDTMLSFRYSDHATITALHAMTSSRNGYHSPITTLEAMPAFSPPHSRGC